MELKLTFSDQANIRPTNYVQNTTPTTTQNTNYNLQNNYVNTRTIIPNPRLVPNMYIAPKIQSAPVVPINNNTPGQPTRKCCGNTNVY